MTPLDEDDPLTVAAPPKHFRDRLGFEPQGFRDVLKIMASGGFGDQKSAFPFASRVPRVEGARVPDARGRAAATWVGHASFVLQVGGLTFLTDPVWSEKLPGGVRRLTPAGVPWDALPKIDGVLISHNHYDHLDVPTIDRLPRDTPVFVPQKVGRWFEHRGFSHVTELDWWERATLGGVALDFVPAQHWSRRGIADHSATLWGGWVVTPEAREGRVYFAGDSGYCDWFSVIGKRFPDIDLAILPIGAYDPRWFMKPVHVNPEEAVQAFLDLGAKRFVPMHWGTFVLTREPFLEPRERLLAEWARRALPADSLWDLALGETRTLDA